MKLQAFHIGNLIHFMNVVAENSQNTYMNFRLIFFDLIWSKIQPTPLWLILLVSNLFD